MSVEVTVDKRQIRSIEKRLRATKTAITDKTVLNAILLKLKSRILLRTLSGQDENNRPFVPYSEKYAKEEGKTIVNLQRTGEMLNAMTQKVLTGNKGIIFFNTSDAKTKAFKHQHGVGVPQRKFFGINGFDEVSAVNLYANEIKKAQEKISA